MLFSDTAKQLLMFNNNRHFSPLFLCRMKEKLYFCKQFDKTDNHSTLNEYDLEP